MTIIHLIWIITRAQIENPSQHSLIILNFLLGFIERAKSGTTASHAKLFKEFNDPIYINTSNLQVKAAYAFNLWSIYFYWAYLMLRGYLRISAYHPSLLRTLPSSSYKVSPRATSKVVLVSRPSCPCHEDSLCRVGISRLFVSWPTEKIRTEGMLVEIETFGCGDDHDIVAVSLTSPMSVQCLLLIEQPINSYLLNLSTAIWQAKNWKLFPRVERWSVKGNFLCNFNQFTQRSVVSSILNLSLRSLVI